MVFRHLTGFLLKHGRISKGVLERSSSTNLPKRYPPKGLGKNLHLVVTLDSSKFAEKQCRLHIGNLLSFRPHIALHNQSSLVACRGFDYNRTSFQHAPYPPDTSAFLYYFSPPERPRIAGELRLRLSASDDHPSFEKGSDLLKSNGLPWSRSLYNISKYYTPLYEKLREDGLVSDDLDAVLSALPRTVHIYILYTLNDTFIVDFSSKSLFFSVITEQGIGKISFGGPCAERRSPRRTTYTGSALARFERSTLPEHKGTRTVVIRFLKMLTSVKRVIPLYDGLIVQPKEGDLYRRCRKASDKLNPPVWNANIDKSVGLRGLRLLWDI